MNFDFKSDLRHELLNRFKQIGVRQSSNDLDSMLMDYLTLLKKAIQPKMRDVKYSPSLLAELHSHPKQKVITHLDKLFRSGGNVNHFQNKKLFQTKFHDHLAYEWNIHHFHLSLIPDRGNKFFVKQVKQLLFVLVTDSEAIFLGTDNHALGTFGDVKWLEILHDYFPYTIEPFLDKEIKKIYPDPNGLDRQTLWDKGYSATGTNVKGKVYLNPGLGRTVSGHSMLVSLHALDIAKWLIKITKQFETHYDQIVGSINIEKSTPVFFLKFDTRIRICERTSQQEVICFPNTFKEESI